MNTTPGMWLIRFIFSLGLLCYTVLDFAVPITGNPKGRVTLVEYYDYECPHCRRMAPVIHRLQTTYPYLKVVYRVTPLLTLASRGVARIALAAHTYHEWYALHHALMASRTALTARDALQKATLLGLSARRLVNRMQAPLIQQQLAENIHLVKGHAIRGRLALPIFVFGRSAGMRPMITLTGEQPYTLLAAIVKQLGEPYAPMVSNPHAMPSRDTRQKRHKPFPVPRGVTHAMAPAAIVSRRDTR